MRFLLFWIGILGGVLPTSALPYEDVPRREPARETAENEAAPPEGPADRYSETVIVTASTVEVEADRVPASVEVIDAEEIAARQATSVVELLATVAGLTVARSGSPGQIASLFIRGTESDHTLVLWNGVELNNPYFGGFNWAFQSTAGLARVEIVRGPFSALYGSDAVGGVVQMVSGHRDGFELRVEGGGDGYARTALELGLGNDSLRFDLVGSSRRGDGELDNDFYDSDELLARLDWTFAAGASLGIVARANDSATGIPLASGRPSPDRRIDWAERELALPFRFERERWRLDAQLTSVEYDSRFSDPGDPFGFTASRTESRSLRARLVATRRLAGAARLACGVETETVEVDDRSVFGVNLEGSEQGTDALFAEWHGEWQRQSGAWVIDVGLRLDDNDVFGSETSPRVAVSREVGASGRLFASYGESFRSPSIGELFFPFSGNPDLRPEVGRSFEIGYALERAGWALRLALFENRLEDLIDFDFLTFTNVNVGRARARGLELALAYAAPTWSLRWDATYLEAEDRISGLDLLRRPSASSSLVAAWSPDRWRWSAVARYVGERDDVDPVTFARLANGSYTVLDLAVRWRWTPRLSPYARAENVLDRAYDEVLGFPSPGRTWVGGVAVRY